MRRPALLFVLLLLVSWSCRAHTADPPTREDAALGDDDAATTDPALWVDDASPLPFTDEEAADAPDEPMSPDASANPLDAGAPSSADATVDAGVDAAPTPALGPPFDAGEGGACADGPGPGDLVIDELMIASVAGSGDHGEWLEIRSQLDCALDVRGLRGDAPSGANVRSFIVADDLWLPARGTLVAADSANPVVNHGLPGSVVAWSGQPGDVLRNQGDTLTLRYDGVIVDSVTYPSLPATPGRSLAFPSDCPPERRSDWTAWQTSTASWMPGFFGTPNAPNTDVTCP